MSSILPAQLWGRHVALGSTGPRPPAVYERPAFAGLRGLARRAGLRYCQDYMEAEDVQTNYVDIGPVNKVCGAIPSASCRGLGGPKNILS